MLFDHFDDLLELVDADFLLFDECRDGGGGLAAEEAADDAGQRASGEVGGLGDGVIAE